MNKVMNKANMNKAKLAFLEKAFEAEVTAALSKSPLWFIQSKSKLAVEMVEEGLLQPVEASTQGVLIKGYGLTELGRMTYCASCEDMGDVEDEEDQNEPGAQCSNTSQFKVT